MTKILKSNWFSILWIFIALIHSGHLFRTTSVNLIRTIYIAVLFAVIFLIHELACRRFKFGTEDILFFISIFMVGFSWYRDAFQVSSFYRMTLSVILFAYFIVKRYSASQVLKVYMSIMTVTSVIALLGFYLANYTDVLEILPLYKNSNGIEYAVAGIFNFIKAVPERNCGMFWEPGLFATHLCIATVIELTAKKRANIFRLILFSVCFVTANSSAGFVLLFLCVLLFFIRKNTKKEKSRFGKYFVVGIVAVAVIVLLNLDYILTVTGLSNNQYFEKLMLANILDSSRIRAIIHNLKLFASSPKFGVGYVFAIQNIKHVADTSTSTFVMSLFGVLGIFYTLAIVFGIFRLKNVNVLSKFVILAMAFIIVNKEPHLQNVFTWVLMFYLVRGIPKEESLDKKNKENTNYAIKN